MEIRALARSLVLDFEAVPDRTGQFLATEFGVAVGTGCRAFPLRPDPARLPAQPSWAGHHRSLAAATREGRDPAAVAAWFLRFARGRTLLSDACFVDQPLLDALLGERAGEVARLTPFFPAVEAAAARIGIGRETINGWIAEIDETRGPAHHAGEDALVRARLLTRIAARAREESASSP